MTHRFLGLRAGLLDYVNGRAAITNHLQRAIVELVTAEAEFDEYLAWEYNRQVIFNLFTSTGTLHLSAHPVVKVGFNILEHLSYEVDAESREARCHHP